MFGPDEIAADLPPPREDDPSSLRRDIVDELADHLECALARELLRQPGSVDKAEARVLERFGDPRAVGRTLWFDALREQVMWQRMMLGGALVAALVCVLVTGLMYRSLERMRASAMEERSQATALLRQVEDSQARLLTELEDRLNAPSAWNPVEVRLVTDDVDGPPAVGFDVKLTDVTTGRSHVPSMTETSGPDGIVRFPHVYDGSYELLVSAPWKEFHLTKVWLHPGESLQKTIVCPAASPETSLASVEVAWPGDLKDKPIYVCFFPYTFNRVVGKSWTGWSTSPRHRYFPFAERTLGDRSPPAEVKRGLFVGPEGRFFSYGSSGLRYQGKYIPDVPENHPHAHLLRWQEGGIEGDTSVVYLVPGQEPEDADRSSPPDPPQHLNVLATSYSTYTPKQWTSGEPGRVVITPPKEVVEILRQYFAAQAEPANSDRTVALQQSPPTIRRVLMPGAYQIK